MNSFKKRFIGFESIEIYFFYALLLTYLIPVFSVTSFLTVDGPSHLYNLRIMQELIENPQSVLHTYFEFNSSIHPNWTGHIILYLLGSIMPLIWAEKMLLAFLIVGIPLMLRSIFKSLKLKSLYLLYFIFPFSYSFLLYYGFYNFYLGLFFFLAALAYYFKYCQVFYTFKRLSILVLLYSLCLASHLVPFAFLIGTLGLISLLQIAKEKTKFFSSSSNWISLILALLGFGVILIYHFNQNSVNGSYGFLSIQDLSSLLLESALAKGVSYGKEGIFTKWISILLALHIVYQITYGLVTKIKPTRNSILFGILSLSSILMLFTLPDSLPMSASFISMRITFFIFIFLILFTASFKSPSWLKVTSFILINYVNIALLNIYYQNSLKNQEFNQAMAQAALMIKNNSIVLPVNQSKEWIKAHWSNQLGYEKPLVILENYEAQLGYFPLRWNQADSPKLPIGDFKTMPNNSVEFESYNWQLIDYLILLKDSKEESKNIFSNPEQEETFLEGYELIFSSAQNIELYKKRE